jgi:hypothetical protein
MDMELTRKRKIMIGTLAVGLTALAVDRLVIGPPNTAQAAGPLVTDSPASDTAPVPAEASEPNERERNEADASGQVLPRYAELSERLRSLANTSQARPDEATDLFAQPDAWAPAEPVAAQAAQPTGPIQDPATFLATHRLVEIADTGRDGVVAIIGSRKLKVGDTLEGFILRGFIQNTRAGNAAVWESIKTGQLIRMQVGSEPDPPAVTDGPAGVPRTSQP